MNNTEDSDSRGQQCGIWVLALLGTALAAAFGVYNVYLFFDRSYPEFYWSRTIAAFVAVAFATGGPAVPLLLIVRRTAFMRLPSAGQWVVLVLMPVGYVTAFGLLLELARNSRPAFLATQTMTLRHAPADSPPLDFYVPGGMNARGRGYGGDNGELVIEWECWWLPSRLRQSGDEPDLKLQCRTSQDDERGWELTIDVATDRNIVFDVDGFVYVCAKKDGGTASLPLELDQGTHEIVVNARPK